MGQKVFLHFVILYKSRPLRPLLLGGLYQRSQHKYHKMHKTWRHATRGTHLVPIVLTWYEIPVHTEFSFSKSISTAALTTHLLRTEMRAGSTTEKAPVDDVHISHLKGHFYWNGFRKSHATQKSCQANLVFLLLACVWKHGKQGF